MDERICINYYDPITSRFYRLPSSSRLPAEQEHSVYSLDRLYLVFKFSRCLGVFCAKRFGLDSTRSSTVLLREASHSIFIPPTSIHLIFF